MTGADMETKKLLCALLTALILVPATLSAEDNIRVGEAYGPTQPLLASADNTVGSSEKSLASGAKAIFPEPEFEFVPVLEGSEVNHSYRVINKGSGELNILDVKTG